MIDNPDQVERLVALLRESLPLFATVTPEVAAAIREQSPKADQLRRYPISQVDYAGDEGGTARSSLVRRTTARLFLPRSRICVSVMQDRSLVNCRLPEA
jgi:hypothetical protein